MVPFARTRFARATFLAIVAASLVFGYVVLAEPDPVVQRDVAEINKRLDDHETRIRNIESSLPEIIWGNRVVIGLLLLVGSPFLAHIGRGLVRSFSQEEPD